MAGAKAAFLDRDGVINRDKGYVFRKEEFEFIDGVFEACRVLESLDYKIIIATNQSGIGRGYYTEDDFQALNDWMLGVFAENQVNITAVYYCPYHPQFGLGRYRQDSPYRKPGPQMLLDAAAEYRLDLRASFIVGDKLSDYEAGRAAGVSRCYLIGDGIELPSDLAHIKVYPDLLGLVRQEFDSTVIGV